MTKVDLFHNLRVKFNELSLREYTIVEEVIEELQGETEATKELEKENASLKEQIEKMKCCMNCRHSRTEYEHCKTDKHEKWEIKE